MCFRYWSGGCYNLGVFRGEGLEEVSMCLRTSEGPMQSSRLPQKVRTRSEAAHRGLVESLFKNSWNL